MRKQSQVELAFTDAIMLGFNDIPVRLSGDIAGTPGAIIIGPKGVVELKEGVIRAAIHVHMNPGEAALLRRGQGRPHEAAHRRPGGHHLQQRSRPHRPHGRLNVHMDTDEANACGLHLTKDIELFK
jgi:putative phosphotransacetylase